jgi:hypothetical protein
MVLRINKADLFKIAIYFCLVVALYYGTKIFVGPNGSYIIYGWAGWVVLIITVLEIINFKIRKSEEKINNKINKRNKQICVIQILFIYENSQTLSLIFSIFNFY